MLTRIGWRRRAPVGVPQEILDVDKVSIRYFVFCRFAPPVRQ
jgi:hypothetical protein